MTGRVAAVDIGTNSVRLLIGTAAGRGLDVLVREMRITRLGQDTDRTGRLADEAVERTVAVLRDYAERWRQADVERVRITATSAARDADNAAMFASRVQAVTGLPPEVLSGEEEAALAFAGAITAADPSDGPFAVLDIGGGSTEMIVGQEHPLASTSRQVGSVRVTERFLHDDPPTHAQLARARAMIDIELDEVARLVQPQRARVLIGTAGTVTTVAAVHLGLPEYLSDRIHGTVLTAANVGTITDALAAMTVRERAALGGMAPGREDVIVGGALILSEVMSHLGFDRLLVSEADILDGIALSLLS